MKSAHQSHYSSNKSKPNIPQKQQNSLANQISEFQKYDDFSTEERGNSSQQIHLFSSGKHISNFNQNGGSEHDSQTKTLQGTNYNKKGEEYDFKEKKQSSQKEIHSQSPDHTNERKQSISNPQNYYQDSATKQSQLSKPHTSKIHKLSVEQRQQFTNFRMKRELWIRDLQEVFNKIYENFVNTLKTIKENQTVRRTKGEKLKFRKHLRNQMKEIQKIAGSLGDKNDDFINLHDNLPITHYYKSNIMEMHKLLSILLKLQMDNKQLDKIKTQKRYDNKCSEPLLQEIKRSYRRVQRLKAGNRLGQVITDQLEDPEIAALIADKDGKDEVISDFPVTKTTTKQMIVSFEMPTSNQQINLLSSQKIKDINQNEKGSKSTSKNEKNLKVKNIIEEENEYKTQESEDDYDPYQIGKDIDPKYFDKDQNLDVDFAIKEFNKKKSEMQQMIEKFAENVNKKDFNFNDKYLNFKEYFSKRYELMGIYLGDSKLNQFLEENEKNANQTLQNNNGEYFDDDEIQNLYKDLDPTNFQIDDKNIEALQRIIKINEEIRKNLLEDEHANKIKVLDQMNVEQNQQFWTSVFEKRSAANLGNNTSSSITKSSNTQLKTARSAVTLHNKIQQNSEGVDKQNKFYQTQNLQSQPPREEFFKNDKEAKKQQLKLYHDYIHRNINYNAHPSNPNLKPVLTGKYDTDKIKFIKVSENQPTNIVSSQVTVEKEQNLKKQSIVNKIHQNNKIGEEFQKTFYQSTLYSQRSNSQLNSQINNKDMKDIQIKFPQNNKNLMDQYIIPKFRGQHLSYEEEMKLISKQTRKDNPLYLNKFNARNYLARVGPSSQKHIRQHTDEFQQDKMSKTQNNFQGTKKKLSSLLQNQPESKLAEINISNPLSTLPRKIQQPFQADQFTSSNKQFGNNTSTGFSQNKIISFKEEDKDKQLDLRQNFFTRPSKDLYKDEISTVFRVSQRDLLFKINGPNWKAQAAN